MSKEDKTNIIVPAGILLFFGLLALFQNQIVFICRLALYSWNNFVKLF